MTDAPFQLGDRVIDTDKPSEEREEAVVVDFPEKTADEFPINERGTTVADVNLTSPSDDPVVTVAFVDALDTWASGWELVPTEDLAERLAMLDDVTLYTYPASRLNSVEDT